MAGMKPAMTAGCLLDPLAIEWKGAVRRGQVVPVQGLAAGRGRLESVPGRAPGLRRHAIPEVGTGISQGNGCCYANPELLPLGEVPFGAEGEVACHAWRSNRARSQTPRECAG